jgi:hypothetical protein
MGERHSEFDRDKNDFYVEPSWCVDRLLARYPEITSLHDPCCGRGTIVDAALKRGVIATGADIVDRARGRFPVKDFLSDQKPQCAIVTNPPFKLAEQIVERAMNVVDDWGLIAIIAQAKFLSSQGRFPLFDHPSMEKVIIFSRRPSMPPGEMLEQLGESCRRNGSIDFAWMVWRVGKTAPGAQIEWTL